MEASPSPEPYPIPNTGVARPTKTRAEVQRLALACKAKSPLKDKPIKFQLATIQLVEQYLDVQFQVHVKLTEIEFPSVESTASRFEQYLRNINRSTYSAMTYTSGWRQQIQAKLNDLEQQAKEQETIEELVKGSTVLKGTVTDVANSSYDKSASSTKRSFEEYNKLEEQALKALDACKKLKGCKEN